MEVEVSDVELCRKLLKLLRTWLIKIADDSATQTELVRDYVEDFERRFAFIKEWNDDSCMKPNASALAAFMLAPIKKGWKTYERCSNTSMKPVNGMRPPTQSSS